MSNTKENPSGGERSGKKLKKVYEPAWEGPHQADANGIQRLYFFQNGYGASVLKCEHSYGGKQGLWELAVVIGKSSDCFRICYTTHITQDVIGYLDEEEVQELLAKIEKLPRAKLGRRAKGV